MSTVSTPSRTMTAEEFADWVQRPENANKWFELVRGEVIELPPLVKTHGAVCVNVIYELNRYVRQRRKGYLTSNDSGVILERDPDTVRGPDVALYEDAHKFSDLHPKYGEVPPLLAVEVLSPSDRLSGIISKVNDYLQSGVTLVWVVDPQNRDVTVFRPGKPAYTVVTSQELTGMEVLPDFHCRVANFFYLPAEMPAEKTASS